VTSISTKGEVDYSLKKGRHTLEINVDLDAGTTQVTLNDGFGVTHDPIFLLQAYLSLVTNHPELAQKLHFSQYQFNNEAVMIIGFDGVLTLIESSDQGSHVLQIQNRESSWHFEAITETSEPYQMNITK